MWPFFCTPVLLAGIYSPVISAAPLPRRIHSYIFQLVFFNLAVLEMTCVHNMARSYRFQRVSPMNLASLQMQA